MTALAPARARPTIARLVCDPGWAIGAAAALALLALALFDPRLLNDGDTYWHLAAGGWIIDHGQAPHVDPFSFTRAGAPWRTLEWLSEVAMAAAFRLGGWSGLVTLYGAALAATVLLLNEQLRRSLSGLSLVLTLTLAIAPITPNLLARPHILVLPVVVAWMAMLLRAREADRPPPLWAAALMLLWANLHGSFIFGFVLLGGFALEAAIEATGTKRWPVIRDWSLFGALTLAGAALTPQGLDGLIFPFKLMGMTSLAGIDEWRPIDFSHPGPFELALLAAVFVGFSRGIKVPPIRLLMLIGLLHMALQHNRHAVIAALVAAMILAKPLAEALDQPLPATRGAGTAAWAGFAILAASLLLTRAALPVVRTDGPTTPGAALDHVPAAVRSERVFNDYRFGGFLIFRGVRPYVDGRTDLYGDAFMNNYDAITQPGSTLLARTLEGDHIAWTLLSPGAPATAAMDAMPGWRRLYADRYAVVHVRAQPAS